MRSTICYLSAILLFIAIFSMPYGFYKFLKVEVFVASIYALIFLYINSNLLISEQSQFDRLIWPSVVFFIILLIFNPFFSIPLGKALWAIVDIASALYFLLIGFTQRGR